MRRLIIGVALVAMVTCGRQESAKTGTHSSTGLLAWQSNYSAAVAQAKTEHKLVMVDIYTDWCGWCKRLDKDVYANPDVAAKLAGSFVAVKLNPEKSKEAAEVSKKFGTRGFPHIVFVEGDGNKVDEIGGYVPASEFLQRLNSLTAKK